ncbi:dTMP kinase [Blastopirellula marina]|uniref:Thymidylate kinase n=1 Tax=Blastopirellula marina TaxID=124 RepID=A0A2S8G2D8_9BACT|nr:dTMP kinase [Blastopirellula marina]PQO38606.1 dTMP kinase [Blastopirellula marina]PTL45263.1 dTMP kinase [Blastopirellula marina]
MTKSNAVRPLFISFDGIDGAGKSTQRDLLTEWLGQQGHDVVLCRDPGTTEAGERVRDLLLHRKELDLHPRTEMLLYMAARAQLVDDIVRPAIAAGQTVLCDRYLLANIAYQGHASGLDPEDVRNVGKVAVDHVMPDLTILLDLPEDIAFPRLGKNLDRMEAKGVAFMHRVREGFLKEAEVYPHVVVVDAAQPIETIQTAIREAVTLRLKELAR